ncbi:MAG: plastocyanin/azurin family copper-binding protein [Haloarculaceae archaeon]
MDISAETTSRRRRTVLASLGTTVSIALAGCSSSGGSDGDDGSGDGDEDGPQTVAVGPNNELVFEPETVTIGSGGTVRWEFESPSHNVCAWPEMHEAVSLPDGASGFGTMEQGGDEFATVPKGETFEHTFETPGEYTYVCVPHAAADMIGTVVVE